MFGLFKKRVTVVRSFFRACNVYCRPESDQAIVASVFNHAGPTAEKPGGAVITVLSNALALSEVIRSSLASCEYQENFNYSQLKPSDWPAYQVSGYKTIKRFEDEFIRLAVRGVNDANLFFAVTTPKFGEHGLHLSISVNAHKGNFGEAVQYVVKEYLTCRAAVDEGA